MQYTFQLKEGFSKPSIDNDKIIISDVVKNELIALGYSRYEIEDIFFNLKDIIFYRDSNKKQISKAKDLSMKRKIPFLDALHALISRDNKSTLVTFDKHFKQITDIVKTKTSKELI